MDNHPKGQTMEQHEIRIEGMTCGGCVRAVEKAIVAADPAAQAQVDLAAAKAAIRSGLPRSVFVEAIEAAGYDVANSA